MKTKVARWGNSLALRIPRQLAVSQRFVEGTDIEIVEAEGELRLRPADPDRQKLKDLLDGVTEENLHSEEDFGKIEGNEIW